MVLGIAWLLCLGFALEVDGHDPAGDSVASRRLSPAATRQRRLRPMATAIDIGRSGEAPIFLAQLGRRLHCASCPRPYHTRFGIGYDLPGRRRDGRGEPD